MDLDGVEELTIGTLTEAYQTGAASVEEVTAAYLERIERFDLGDGGLNSIVTVSDDAIDRARAADQELRANPGGIGPLHGIPIVVKDQIETTRMPTSFGSTYFADFRPRQDATVVRRLEQAGALILAKTAMPDFASSWFSTSSLTHLTMNPYDVTRDPGGSSSGSGAAVAANLAVAGLGGDTGGSIRLPASYCNLVGLRVTPGLVSRAGVSPLCGPIDTVGPMARSVADAAALLQVLSGYDDADPFTATGAVRSHGPGYLDDLDGVRLSDVRLGVVRQLFADPSDADEVAVAGVIDDALDTLRSAGAQIVEIEIPDLMDTVFLSSLYFTRSYSDLSAFLGERIGMSLAEFRAAGHVRDDLDLLVLIAEGIQDPHQDPEYATRLLAQARLREQAMAAMAAHGLDAFVYPTSPRPAPTHADIDAGRWTNLTYPTNTIVASQLAFPALSVPVGFTSDGLPVGLEIVTPPFEERRALRIGRAVEREIPARRAPVLSVTTPTKQKAGK